MKKIGIIVFSFFVFYSCSTTRKENVSKGFSSEVKVSSDEENKKVYKQEQSLKPNQAITPEVLEKENRPTGIPVYKDFVD